MKGFYRAHSKESKGDPMHAALDIGNTLTKVVWHNGEYQFASTAVHSLENILERLRADNVTELHLAGSGAYTIQLPKDFSFNSIEPDPKNFIEAEVTLQAKGAKKLLELEGKEFTDLHIVSIGSGISYTHVDYAGVNKEKIGNTFGGAFMWSMAQTRGAKTFEEFVEKAQRGVPQNLVVKDKIPSLANERKGNFVMAFGGKLNEQTTDEDFYATLVSGVAIAVASDLQRKPCANDVLYIGTTVETTPPLRAMLQMYTAVIGKRPHFLDKGAYALAMGAYLHAQGL